MDRRVCAATGNPVTERIYNELTRALKRPEIVKQLSDQSLEPWIATQQEFAKRLRADYEKFQRIFKIIGTPAKS